MGFPRCLYQHCCCHDHLLPWLYQKVSLLFTKRRCVLLWAGITSWKRTQAVPKASLFLKTSSPTLMTWSITFSIKGLRRCSFCSQFSFDLWPLKGEFKQAVEKITGLKITDRESEYLFKMVDANHDGIIDAENELNLHKHRTPEYVTYGREQTEILLNDQNHAWVIKVIQLQSLHICQTLSH